jgi:hypothetical protein
VIVKSKCCSGEREITQRDHRKREQRGLRERERERERERDLFPFSILFLFFSAAEDPSSCPRRVSGIWLLMCNRATAFFFLSVASRDQLLLFKKEKSAV